MAECGRCGSQCLQFFQKRRDGQEQYHVRDQYDPHDVGELYDRRTEEEEIQTAAEQRR